LRKRTASLTRWLGVAIVLAIIGAIYWHQRPLPHSYVSAVVSRGPIIKSVTATGTVNPVTTVQVGTYVSGKIVQLYVDFNSPVKANQLMAKIDPRPFAAQVALSKAALANARAQLQKDQANLAYQALTYIRDQEMIKEKVISTDQLDSQLNVYDQARAQVALSKAAVQQQEANLRQAELNLSYTNIVSPVDGTVVSRNIDMGQTVAASFQTPVLFLVAKDLTKMQVDTSLSESDVGGVRNGQAASFTVDAYPGRTFHGSVAQVRQAPITVQNVVTYDVVVDVSNPEMLLKPGMTANVTIITDRVDGVLRVPLQALRFSPQGFLNAAADGQDNDGQDTDSEPRQAIVWVKHGTRLTPVHIERGLDDGTQVAVLDSTLHAGERVVIDELQQSHGRRARAPFGPFHGH